VAKKPIKSKKQSSSKSTNWFMIAGIILVGAIGIFALLYFTLRTPEAKSLAAYCTDAPQRCVALGSADAPIKLVEVGDFGCVHCQDFHQTKAEQIKANYVDTGEIQWIFVPYALSASTVPAANAAMCANEQGKYFEFANALYNNADLAVANTRDGLIAAGEAAGVEPGAFLTCIEDGRYTDTINANQLAASAAGVTGTPTFFVNDQVIRGNVPLAEFENRFQAVLGS
jgi:protein-disulfide isomerase